MTGAPSLLICRNRTPNDRLSRTDVWRTRAEVIPSRPGQSGAARRNVSMWAAAMALGILLPSLPAGAVDPAAEPETIEPSEVPSAYSPGWLPAAGAVVPGVLLHGSGVYLAGDRDTALDLLWLQGAGVAGTVGGMTVLAVTGASRRTVRLNVGAVVGSVGLFLLPWFSDIYGAATGGRCQGSCRNRYPS